MLQPVSHALPWGQGGPAVGAAVVAHATPHSKGAWVQMIDSTDQDAGGVLLSNLAVVNAPGTDVRYYVDVGIGAAASERVVVEAVMFTNRDLRHFQQVFCRIPAGSRVALRAQSNVASKSLLMTCSVGAHEVFGGPEVATAYGFTAASSTGKLLTTAGSADAKSAWTELVASTTRPMRWITACGAQHSTSASVGLGSFDIAVGPSGSEQIIIADIGYQGVASEISYCTPGLWPCNLPAGVRLAARYQYTNTTAGNAPAVVVHGMD